MDVCMRVVWCGPSGGMSLEVVESESSEARKENGEGARPLDTQASKHCLSVCELYCMHSFILYNYFQCKHSLMSSSAAAAASSSSQTQEMPPPAALLPPAAATAATTIGANNQVEETEAEAAEEDDGFAAQGYTPLVNLDEDDAEGGGMEGGIEGGMGMMMPPPAAGGGWGEEEEDEEDGGEGDSEGDRRNVDFESITSRILAQMEAEYTHTRAQGGEEGGMPVAAAAGASVGNRVRERRREGRAGMVGGDAIVAAAGVASLSLHDEDDGNHNEAPTAFSSSCSSSSTSPQPQAAPTPPPSSLLPPPPPRPLSPSKEEQIRRVMAGVVLSPQITPAWATGVDWEGPELKRMLAWLQGE